MPGSWHHALLPRTEARAVEQALILRNRGLNLRNSISPARTWYKEAVKFGVAWLKENGF
jgi:hypothetical protein